MAPCQQCSWLALLTLSALQLGRPRSAAALEERSVRYTIGAQVFEGFAALPSSVSGSTDGATVPGVLIAHQWMGPGSTERARARELAGVCARARVCVFKSVCLPVSLSLCLSVCLSLCVLCGARVCGRARLRGLRARYVRCRLP